MIVKTFLFKKIKFFFRIKIKNTYEKDMNRFYQNMENSVDALLKFHENIDQF